MSEIQELRKKLKEAKAEEKRLLKKRDQLYEELRVKGGYGKDDDFPIPEGSPADIADDDYNDAGVKVSDIEEEIEQAKGDATEEEEDLELPVHGTERQNKIIGVAGRKGSGKSTIARKILENSPRLFLFDQMGEHSWVPERFDSIQESVMFLMETPYRETFMGSMIPSGDDVDAEFAEVCVEVYDAGNMMFGVEEIPMLSTAGYVPKKFNKVVRLGRHRNLSILYTAQRLSECPRALTSATDIFVLFCHSEPRDLDTIADRCGTEIAEKVQELGDHGFLIWDVLERRERPITGDWYSQLTVTSGSRVNPL